MLLPATRFLRWQYLIIVADGGTKASHSGSTRSSKWRFSTNMPVQLTFHLGIPNEWMRSSDTYNSSAWGSIFCHSAPPFFLFFSINWFRKIEIPRKKVRQRWKQTIKSWDSARCQACCASCNRQISLKLFDGNSSFTHPRWISLWKHYRRKSSPKQNVGLEFGRSRPVHIQ